MIFEFGGSPELASPREAVWRHLQDGDTMAACTPGAESFEVRGPGRYSVTCAVGAGLIRVHVVLEAELHDLVHPESLRLRATGTAPGSTLNVDTLVRLDAVGAGRTRLSWTSVTTVHGMLAGFGRGMIEDVLRQFTERFWNNVAQRLATAPRTGAFLLTTADLLELPVDALVGAVLLAGTEIGGARLPKGHRLNEAEAAGLRHAVDSGALAAPLRLGWVGAHELHERDAADLLATAAAGPGTAVRPGAQGRVDLLAAHRGVLVLSLEGIQRLNAIDPLELFTRWNHLPVEEGEVLASIKVGPHIVEQRPVLEGEGVAREFAPLISVRPYAGLSVAALVAELLAPTDRDRFESASRLRAESLGGGFLGMRDVSAAETGGAHAAVRAALEDLALLRHVDLLLIGGVSAGDPLAPFFSALEELGGHVFRRGVPAHPGSMLWLGRLGKTLLLGLPRCGAFGMATAADLLLPRIMTGEELTAESVASLALGGMLGREMRFRFPAYARELPEPPAS